ncbi:ATP-binding protein, partial [Vibrio anguillarum]|nr:ATP-binding protein [Vibrio anguillarum]
NEIPGVLELMEQAKDLLRPEHPKVYAAMKEALRILRKVKYNQ